MNTNPTISVVMSVYNAEKYLDEAIKSILNQTYRDFEFVIINDGSTDKSLEIIEKYKNQDDRIVLICRENRGLILSLNEGIEKARGKYIVRMDADDISLPIRFEKQIKFMEENEDIAVCGSWISIFGARNTIHRYPVEDAEIKSGLLFNSTFAHPSVMMRKEIFNQFFYEEEFQKAEDYRLWVQLMDNYKFHNLPIVLLNYRIHENQTNKVVQLETANQIRQEILKKYDLNINLNDYLKICNYKIDNINSLLIVFKTILDNENIKRIIDEKALKTEFGKLIWRLININKSNRIKNFLAYCSSIFFKDNKITFIQYIRFFVRIVLRFPDGK